MDSWQTKARYLMRVNGITQDDLTDVLGVNTRGAVGHYLSGRRRITAEQSSGLCRALGVTHEELFGIGDLTDSFASIHDVRRTNLISILKECSYLGVTNEMFAKQANIPAPNLSAMKNGTRNIGSSTALRLESAAGKPRGWLDSPDNNSSENGFSANDEYIDNKEINTGAANVELHDFNSLTNLSKPRNYCISSLDLLELGLSSSDVLVFEISDNSMISAFKSGDFALVNTKQIRPISGKVFLVLVKGSPFITQFTLDTEGKWFMEGLTCRDHSHPLKFTVLGQVVSLVKRVMI